jgi:hypothetical protein
MRGLELYHRSDTTAVLNDHLTTDSQACVSNVLSTALIRGGVLHGYTQGYRHAGESGL